MRGEGEEEGEYAFVEKEVALNWTGKGNRAYMCVCVCWWVGGRVAWMLLCTAHVDGIIFSSAAAESATNLSLCVCCVVCVVLPHIVV